MKTVILILLAILPAFTFEMNTGTMYTGWPEKDSLLHGAVEITADSAAPLKRQPIQVIYLVDISRESAGRVREGLIEGGKNLIKTLRDGDRFGIILYSKYSRTLFPLTPLDKEKRSEAIDLLERISTEEGRNLSSALEKANSEFLLRKGEKTDGRYLVLSSLGKTSKGKKGMELYDQLVSGTADNAQDYALYTVGYGETFNEDVMIQSAETSGGRAFFAPKDRPDSLLSIFKEIGEEISAPTMKDIEIYFSFPDSDVKMYHFGTNTPLPNPIKIKQLSRSKKYRIIFSMKNRPKRSSALDIDIEYFTVQGKNRLSSSGGIKLAVSTEPIYAEKMAPSLIQYSILHNLSKSITMFRRFETEMKPKEAKEFRKNYAFKFQQQVLNRVETVRDEINTPEMEYTYSKLKQIFEVIREGVYDAEYIIRHIKYDLHQTIHGK